MVDRNGGAGASSLDPSMVNDAPGRFTQMNFIRRAPSARTDPGPPGRKTTVPSGQSIVARLSFPKYIGDAGIPARTRASSDTARPFGAVVSHAVPAD
jgi:hypothetical protein